MRFKLGRPSPALVIACISLFVALGGVGYAAATGSIDGREIKNNSVASKDAKNNSFTGTDVKQSSLKGADVAANSLTGSDVDEGSLGKVPSAGQADNAGTGRERRQRGQREHRSAGSTLRKVTFRPSGNVANGADRVARGAARSRVFTGDRPSRSRRRRRRGLGHIRSVARHGQPRTTSSRAIWRVVGSIRPAPSIC